MIYICSIYSAGGGEEAGRRQGPGATTGRLVSGYTKKCAAWISPAGCAGMVPSKPRLESMPRGVGLVGLSGGAEVGPGQ